jgi:ACS family glucarate transporter-like MFS transporter
MGQILDESHHRDASGAVQPTRIRFRVLGLTILLGMVTYLDRVCISVLAPDIQEDLTLSKMEMSFVFSAFALAYAAFEIPTAWWADRVGTRTVLTRIVIWWSSFTIATAAAFNYASLLVIRFLFGMGEAGAWPSVARTFSRWSPRRERGTVQGIFFTGAHLAGGLTPLLVMRLTHVFNWRVLFVLFGMVGFVWAAFWYRWFRDDPSEHPQVNALELQHIVAERLPDAGHSAGWDYWRRLLSQRNILALCLMYLPNSFAFYFCITWLPTYLKERHGLTETSLGIFAGLPLVLSVLADLFGGLTTDWAVARFGLRVGRCGVGGSAYLVASLAMILAIVSTEPMVAATCISVATAASMFMLGAAWGTCLDIGGNHAGVVSATMNTAGQIGSLLSPIAVTYLADKFSNWNAPLYLIAFLFLLGAASWCFVDPRRPVFENNEPIQG